MAAFKLPHIKNIREYKEVLLMEIDYDTDPRLSILNVAYMCGLTDIKEEGYRFTATCPFCGAKPGHFYLTPTDRRNPNYKNVYRCVKCGAAGSNIKLYAELHSCSTKEAFKEIMGFDVKSSVVKKIKKMEKKLNKPVIPMADIDTRDKVYRKLISLLYVSDKHLGNLVLRGLTEKDIRKNGYATLPESKYLKRKICIEIQKCGFSLKGIPGFYPNKYKNWTFWTPKKGGFLVPVRDIYGRIQGCQIRKNGENIKKKYPWFSSGYMNGGCATQGFFHVYWNSKHSGKKVVITEGALKATVAGILSDTTFLAIPGVNSYNGCAEILKKMKAKRIFVAYDMDRFDNSQVMENQVKLIQYLKSEGFSDIRVCTWNPSYKGIDDYLKHIVG
ncbi:DUF3854 domain-containing protein [Clostridium sp. HV4-5-A1G]|nr:DUF3854 domain-containing protein [Clostridium sp. HV4-5-A1G]